MGQFNYYSLLGMLTPIFMAVVFLFGACVYGSRHTAMGAKLRKWIGVRHLIRAAVYFRIAYAGLLTVTQYYIWANMGTVGEVFLDAPVTKAVPDPLVGSLSSVFNHPLGYFLFYSYGRFWLNAILSILIAWLFHKILIALRKYNGRFFDDGETELGYVMALVAGWPVFVIFLPLVFLFVVAVSVVRLVAIKEAYTTLGWPMICAAAVCILWGAKLIEVLHFGALNI